MHKVEILLQTNIIISVIKRLKGIVTLNKNIFNWPMVRLFTPEELKPSEKTLNIIRQIAYTYRVIKINGKMQTLCLN